ncbi:hypothetical protein [Nostoc sp.]|uniref:hypothetical protein n=1 Tax=Nostoc sp. TaxID=1180 RepID=UPI002FFCC191
MAFNLNFSNASKKIKFNDLLGFPTINYSKFIGVKDKEITHFDNSVGILGKTVGVEGEVRLTAGLDLQAKLDLGSLNLEFPWSQLGLKLVGNQLELQSNFNSNNILPTVNFTAPDYNLYAGFELGLGGYLDGKLGNNTVTLIPKISTSDARIKYPILDLSSSESSDSGKNKVDLPAAFKEAGFKVNLDYPTTDNKVVGILKQGLQVSTNGISLHSEIPIVTLEADLIRVLSNIPFLKPFLTPLSGTREYFDVFKIDWKLITATLNGGINLKLDTGINFGDLFATLEFEDGSVSSKIPLISSSSLPKIDLGSNPLAKLNAKGGNTADIKLNIGFDSPKLTASAGLYADIYSNLIIGKATATVDALGISKKETIGPLYKQKFDIAKFPIPYLSTGNIQKTLPASLAPIISFTVPIPLSTPDSPLSALQSDIATPLSIVGDNIPIVEILEKQGNTILAKKLEGNTYTYVLYKASELKESDNPLDPYNRADLLSKALILRDTNGNTITEPKDTLDNTPYGEYRPIGAEEDASGNYTVVFSKLLPPFQKSDPEPFIVWEQ